MTDRLATLITSMAAELRRSNLDICQTLSNALDSCAANRPAVASVSSKKTATSLDYINRACPNDNTAIVTDVRRSASHLRWRQPGFGKIPDAVASHMAVCEIIGPMGQITHHAVRAGLLFQDAEILYPSHRHAAEEIYLPLSGPAAWQTANSAWRQHAFGDIIHHLPFQPHAIRTAQTPLLAIWGWTGDIRADSYHI